MRAANARTHEKIRICGLNFLIGVQNVNFHPIRHIGPLNNIVHCFIEDNYLYLLIHIRVNFQKVYSVCSNVQLHTGLKFYLP